jgi:hypothetical protein
VRFTDDDIATMQRRGRSAGHRRGGSWHLDFALGKAFEDRGEAEAAFASYAAGNAAPPPHSLSRRRDRAKVDAMIATATPDLFAAFDGAGADAPDPIFVVGMPRSGSTLVEQILASHSQVEGTSELPDIALLARKVSRIIRRALALPPRNCAPWANSISSGRASSGTRTGRSSSTRCPTTGCMCR